MKKKVEYEYKKISTKELQVDRLYQRDIENKRVEKIKKEFNPYLVNAAKVSYRDGRYYIFDGQHTISALKSLNNGKDLMCDCKVFYGLTRIDEAELFVKQNGVSKNVNIRDRFRALLNIGDKDVVNMNNICESVGVSLGFSNCNPARYRILALSTLFECFMKMGETNFRDMLLIIKESWNGEIGSFSAEILKGMHIFYDTYKDKFKRTNLIKRLSKISPSEIVRIGNSSFLGGSKRYAKAILNVYNANTSAGRLDDLI